MASRKDFSRAEDSKPWLVSQTQPGLSVNTHMKQQQHTVLHTRSTRARKQGEAVSGKTVTLQSQTCYRRTVQTITGPFQAGGSPGPGTLTTGRGSGEAGGVIGEARTRFPAKDHLQGTGRVHKSGVSMATTVILQQHCC